MENMEPQITIQSSRNRDNNENELRFTIQGVNYSFANAIRRIILSEIPVVVFKTTPYEQNKCNIFTNTTRFNNEILKQRLSCIPIHISDFENVPLDNYILELNVENNTDTIMIVTTEHFKIKNKIRNEYLQENDVRNIFPPNPQTGYFIDFVRLRPKISEQLPGEKIHLECEFSVSNAKENGMFNVVSTCAYGNTPDTEKQAEELAKKKMDWNDLSPSQLEFQIQDWKLLDGQRVFLPDSFDFRIETVGVFTNQELVKKACSLLVQKLVSFLESDKNVIRPSRNTLSNSFDVILADEDYTLGKILEFVLFRRFFEGTQILTYCGFKKEHPHSSESIIRLAYADPIEESMVRQHLREAVEECMRVFKIVENKFTD